MPALRGRQDGQRLHVAGLRKHVGDACRQQLEAHFVHEDAKVAGQAPGMAGDINHARGAELREQRQDRARPGARWIEQHMAVAPVRPWRRGPGLPGEIGAMEFGVGNAVEGGVGARPGNEAGIALDADDTARRAGRSAA